MRDALCASEPGVGLIIQWMVLALLALSAWLVLRTGRVSLGQQAYFGLGAYSSAMVTVMAQGSLGMGLCVAMGCAALAAWVVGALLRPLSGLPYAMASLAVAEMCRLGLSSWNWQVQQADGRWVGPQGVQGFRQIRWVFEQQMSQQAYLAVAGALLAVCVLGLWWMQRCRLGMALQAVGLDATLAQAQGLAVENLRWGAQTFAGAVAGLAGALYAHQMTYVEPAIFDAMLGVHAVGYALLGGLATPWGPLLGSGFDLGLLEATRLFEGWRMVIFGGLIALFLRWRPRGLLDEDTLHHLSRIFFLFFSRKSHERHTPA